MELYLQFGYGMRDECKSLIEEWGNGTVILSPRDLNEEQIEIFAAQIGSINGHTLFDPQLFKPHSDHPRLVKHRYWPDSYNTNFLTDPSAWNRLLLILKEYNDLALTDKYILPGVCCDLFDDDWIEIHQMILDESLGIMCDKERLFTLSLSSDILRNEEHVEMILNQLESWDVDGIYLVPEPPKNQYLIEDPIWLSNLMMLTSGIKLQGKNVVVGYSSHQMLCLSMSKVDAISSGRWLNVRSFSTQKFLENDDDSISRRVTWYYCPQALTEFKLPFLDIAHRNGVLNLMCPDELMNSNYANILFEGAQPTTTDYGEQKSFRHYLQCLHEQCLQLSGCSYDKCKEMNENILNSAEQVLRILHNKGVRGADRDFGEFIDVNRAAISSLDISRGFVLTREWDNL